MKKAKIMLTVIVVFAVVGAALAFKAEMFGSKNVYCTLVNNDCVITDYKTTIEPFSAATTTQPCRNPITGLKITTYFTDWECITVRSGTVYTTNAQ